MSSRGCVWYCLRVGDYVVESKEGMQSVRGLVYLCGCLVYLYSGLTHLSRWSVDSSLGGWLGRAGVAAYPLLSYIRCTVLQIVALAGRGSASGFRLR